MKHLLVFVDLVSNYFRTLEIFLSFEDFSYILPQYRYRTNEASFSTSLRRNSGKYILNTRFLDCQKPEFTILEGQNPEFKMDGASDLVSASNQGDITQSSSTLTQGCLTSELGKLI